MCRLQEHIVAHQLTGYLNKHALLYPLQFGFRVFLLLDGGDKTSLDHGDF